MVRDAPEAAHVRGLLIVGLGVVALSPDSLLVRLISTDQWTLLFWRGVLMTVGLTAALAVAKGPSLSAAFRAVGWAGLLAGILFTGSNIFFVTSLTHTDVANTLVILSTVPLFAAALNYLFLAEPVPLRTWLTILVAVASIALIVSRSVEFGSAWGDLAALGAAVCQAGTFVVMRRHRSVNMIPAMAISGVFTALAVAPFAAPLDVSPRDAGLLLLLCLIVLPTAFGLIALGPRYLPAPEVGLVMLLEVVLGPLWVWLVIGEEPTVQAIIGGGMLLTALTVHYGIALRRAAARRSE